MGTRWHSAALAGVIVLTMTSPAPAQNVAPQGSILSLPWLPQGHLYAPGDERLPPLDSPQAQFESQVDVRQTEIYRRQYDRRLFEAEMFRDDLRAGPFTGPNFMAPRY